MKHMRRAQRAQAAKVKQATLPEVTVLYASQTGTAQEVAPLHPGLLCGAQNQGQGACPICRRHSACSA